MRVDLSIIIVNFNSLDYLRECLESIYRSGIRTSFEIIVVDNASYDGSHQMVKARFPDTIFVQSAENHGFAAANNLGFKKSTGNFLLFLNPDTKIVDNAIEDMLCFIKSLPQASIVGCKLLNTDLSVQMSSIKSFPRLINQILDLNVLRRLLPYHNFWGTKPLKNDYKYPCEVEVISGACMMIKKNDFIRIGMFNTDYFMYSEDVDLCYRIKKLGKKAFFLPWVKIIHYGGGSGIKEKENYNSEVIWVKSRFNYFHLHKGLFYARLYKLSIFLFGIPRIFFSKMLLIFFAKQKKLYLHMKYTYNKWIRIMKWAVGNDRK